METFDLISKENWDLPHRGRAVAGFRFAGHLVVRPHRRSNSKLFWKLTCQAAVKIIMFSSAELAVLETMATYHYLYTNMGLWFTLSKTPKYLIQNGIQVNTACEEHLEVTNQLFVLAIVWLLLRGLDKNAQTNIMTWVLMKHDSALSNRSNC